MDIEIKSRTQDELVQLAKDMLAGKVFADSMLPDEMDALVYNIFLPLNKLMIDGGVDWNNVGMMYEYVDKSIEADKDYPVFKTINLVHMVDMFRLEDIFKQMNSQNSHTHDEYCGCDH